ncbi:MAG: CDP-glycerol glycerophosphotransferase family protein, partial [Lachnospiraceae bacterium]|nr:CDP-glycerol glycerophosphotransferase family protein [Lachnospiraceae bacterium]
KPCFLYETDIKKYKKDRDFYFDIWELPFLVAQNSDELVKNILAFDDAVYQKKLDKLFSDVGLCDNGTACRQVVDFIKSL